MANSHINIRVKLNSRYFIRNRVISIIFTEVTLKLYCIEVVNITHNIQYLRVHSLVHIIFFITSKMSGFEPTKQHMRETLLFCFNFSKNSAESHRLLQETYGEHALSETTCKDWYRPFKSVDFDLKDKERPGQPKKFEDEDLEALLNGDRCQTLQQLSNTLNVTEMTLSKRLHNLWLVQKAGN